MRVWCTRLRASRSALACAAPQAATCASRARGDEALSALTATVVVAYACRRRDARTRLRRNAMTAAADAAAAGVHTRAAMTTAVRRLATVSAVYGSIPSPPGGFVTTDIKLDMHGTHGGAYSRAVFATRDIAYGREIMNIPAFCMHVGDELVTDDGGRGGSRQAARKRDAARLRAYVLHMTRDVFTRLVYGTPRDREYIQSRVMTLMPGGSSFFTRERDVYEFAEQVRPPGTTTSSSSSSDSDRSGAAAATGMTSGAVYLSSGEFSSYDLQKLPLILSFNRVDVEYQGRRGVCVFPEACYFNHTCEPNVELTVSYNTVKSNFVLSARTTRPVRAGEELFVHYMPDNTYPLSRFAMAMQQRWGFECQCVRCRSRLVNALVLLTCACAPFVLYGMHTLRERKRERADMM